jgi:hypothetical protein
MFPQESLASSPTACTVATAQLPELAAALIVDATPVCSILGGLQEFHFNISKVPGYRILTVISPSQASN